MKKIKIFLKVILILFLCVLLIGSCSFAPAPASASSSETIETLLDAKTRFTKTFTDVYNNIILLSPDWIWGNYDPPYIGMSRGGGRHRGGAVSDSLSVDVSNATAPDSVTVSPIYTFYGKSRFEYSNGNYEIFETSISITSNSNPVTGGTYTGIPNYTANDFGRSDTNLPTVGTWFIVRSAYNSSGDMIYSRNIAFSFDTMPVPVIFNDGTYGFTPVSGSNSGKFYNGIGEVSNLNMNYNTVRFRVRSDNSITARTELNWESRYDDYRFFTTDFSLNTIWYASVLCSNNDDFNNTINNRLSNNFNSYGINYKPSICKYGIDARTVINNSNVTNYNGFETVNNNITYNYDTYEEYFIQHDEPKILSDIKNIYSSQPAPLDNFDSPVRYNYIDLVSSPESNLYLPESWLANYPAISINPNIEIALTTIPHFTLPSGAVACGAELVEVGYSFYDAVPSLIGILLFLGVSGVLINKFLL